MAALLRTLDAAAELALSLVFALSAVEKFLVIRRGAVKWHPILLALPRRIRELDGIALAISALADVGTVVLLAAGSTLGGIFASVLVVLYSLVALRARVIFRNGGCRCMWKALEARTITSFLFRNACLVLLAILATPPTSQHSTTTVILALGLLVTISAGMRLADLIETRVRLLPEGHF